MTSETSTALKVTVERALRSVQASLPRKKRMRDELLAHVTEVFEEERASSGDEAIALAATSRRFGDPDEIGRQLQDSVPRWMRPLFILDDVMRAVPGDTPFVAALRAARNLTILNTGTVALTFGLALAVGPTTRSEIVGTLWAFILPLAIATALLTFTLVLIGQMLRRDWFMSSPPGSKLRLALLLLLSCIPVVAVPFVFATFAGGMSGARESLGILAFFLPIVPLAMYFATRHLHRELEESLKWSSLQLD